MADLSSRTFTDPFTGAQTTGPPADYLACPVCGRTMPFEHTVRFMANGRQDRRCRQCAGFVRADPHNPSTEPLAMLMKRLDDGLISQEEYDTEVLKLL